MDEGAQILVCKRLSSDMEIPQFEDPAASGYVSVSCSNAQVGLTLSYQEQGYLDDWRSGVAVRVARGFTVGFIGGSDDHTGRQGLVYPNRRSNNVVTFDVKGGLMGLYAKELTREAVWEAMRARRTYATNGERIYLKTSCGDALMGEEVEVDSSPTVRVEVHGIASGRGTETRGGDHPPPSGERARSRRPPWPMDIIKRWRLP